MPDIDPRHTALLVMDYQNGIVGRLDDAGALLARAAEAIALVRGHGGQIDEQLGKRDIHTLVLAGISTSGVVLSTVRDASDRDYQVYVLADASADPDPEVHEFLTGKIFPRQAHVITVAELGTLLADGAAPGLGG
jgi:nicotinamidase-related amidase